LKLIHTKNKPWRNWRGADLHQARRPRLLARNRLTRRVRAFFEGRDFIEVETAALQVSPGNETHLHAFATQALTTDGQARPLYLHTSPEFACKTLLAAGERRIFSLGKVWRNRERGALHHPEFTMLEWYRAEAPYEQLMADCAALVADLAQSEGVSRLRFRGLECDPFAPPLRLSVADAFVELAGFDLVPSLRPDGSTDRGNLAEAARQAGLRVAEDDTWTDIYSKALVERIEPRLGDGCLTLLDRYPISEAALARPDPLDTRFSQRFELYACGVELANAFGELTDPVEQRRRFEVDMDEKERIYGERYPIDEAFLQALAHMPPASGAALGFDRLVMLITGAERIEQVLWSAVP
jgi:lysyl-tRNA synthetase class 2